MELITRGASTQLPVTRLTSPQLSHSIQPVNSAQELVVPRDDLVLDQGVPGEQHVSPVPPSHEADWRLLERLRRFQDFTRISRKVEGEVHPRGPSVKEGGGVDPPELSRPAEA